MNFKDPHPLQGQGQYSIYEVHQKGHKKYMLQKHYLSISKFLAPKQIYLLILFFPINPYLFMWVKKVMEIQILINVTLHLENIALCWGWKELLQSSFSQTCSMKLIEFLPYREARRKNTGLLQSELINCMKETKESVSQCEVFAGNRIYEMSHSPSKRSRKCIRDMGSDGSNASHSKLEGRMRLTDSPVWKEELETQGVQW